MLAIFYEYYCFNWSKRVVLMQAPLPPARLFSFKREKCSNSLQNKLPVNCRSLSPLKRNTLTANNFRNKLTSINIRLLVNDPESILALSQSMTQVQIQFGAFHLAHSSSRSRKPW